MFDSIFPKHWTTLQRLMWLKTNALARAVYEIVTGNPVTFSAKAAPLRHLKVAFSPMQSLNGYDSPWPAGGGKNKYYRLVNTTVVKNGLTITPITDSSFHIKGTATEGTEIDAMADSAVISLKAGTYTASGNLPDGGSLGWVAIFKSGQVSGPIANWVRTSEPATFTLEEDTDVWARIYITNGQALDQDVFVQIESGSTPTAFAPYSNECPISGWSSVTVEQRGKNLVDFSSFATTNITYENGVLTGASSAFASAYGTSAKAIPFSCDGADQLTLSLEAYTDGNSSTTGVGLVVRFYYDDATLTSLNFENSDTAYTAKSVTSTSGKKVIGIGFTYGTNGANIWHIRNLQLEYGSTATEYVPYNPLSRSISISLGETVYGGYVDVISGVLKVDMAEVDLNDLNWSNTQYSAEGRGVFYSALADAKVYAIASKADCLSEKYATNAINGLISHPNCIGIGNKQVWCSTNSSETTPTGKLVYELAEPLVFQLTPQEVQSLLGVNNLWSDANGNLTVEYRSN